MGEGQRASVSGGGRGREGTSLRGSQERGTCQQVIFEMFAPKGSTEVPPAEIHPLRLILYSAQVHLLTHRLGPHLSKELVNRGSSVDHQFPELTQNRVVRQARSIGEGHPFSGGLPFRLHGGVRCLF